MDAFQIVDALAASFFGLIGIWAAVVRRHWFLRLVVVSVFLLSTLLITAHEIAIEFGIQIALLMAGVWLARNWGRWEIRFSLESALLLMVVVAVVSAVMGKADDLSWWTWLVLITNGVCTAGYGLCCLWLIFGNMRLRYRLPLAILGLLAIVGLFHLSEGLRHAIWASLNAGDWQVRIAEHYRRANVAQWLTRNMPAVLLGAAIICLAMLFGRKCGWFDETPTEANDVRWPALLSRIGLIAVISGVALPLVYIFYRLMTPAQLPAVEVLKPNGFDDIIAAGNMIDDDVNLRVQNSFHLPEHELKDLLDSFEAPLQLVSVGVSRPNFQIDLQNKTPEQAKADRAAFDKVANALIVELGYVHRFGTNEQRTEWALKTLRLGKDLARGWEIEWPEDLFIYEIRSLLGGFKAAECRRLVEQLCQHDRQRPSVEDYLLHRRVKDENGGWERHINLLLRTWSGEDPYENEREQYHWSVARFRMLIAQLALQSYFLDQDCLPESLEQLVPDYLPTIPRNPHTGELIGYQHLWGGYALTCSIDQKSSPYIVTGPAAPYLLQRLRASWREFQEWIDRFPIAPR